MASGCAHRPATAGYAEEGIAGYYGKDFDGRRTASGAIFHAEAKTCAHRTLPFGAIVEVTRLDNGRSVVVTVTDRGPFVSGRIIDLSLGAARQIGLVQAGLTRVRIAVLSVPPSKR
ncbi:MAG: septal ring lytic transglycosylase RlpA family protein [Deltaproteobacteria bacterium]|nr:septal ring lytic transglycosylase RlpA family protein [Deltaproteobacteria bacterium]